MKSALTNTTAITFCSRDQLIDAEIIGQTFKEKVDLS